MPLLCCRAVVVRPLVLALVLALAACVAGNTYGLPPTGGGTWDDGGTARIPCKDRVDAVEGAACYALKNYTNGLILEELDAGEPFCDSAILLPGQRLWPLARLRFVYLMGLLYCFLGVAIVADIFMAAIEIITSRKKTVVRQNPVTRRQEEVSVLVWNPTVANLSLMALGSSAPEILLAVIGTLSTINETPDVLGPATIVGSAAFNLLGITAVCIYCIPAGEVRRVKETKVFIITAFCSIFAYLWLYVVLEDDVVKVWEAVLTFAFFPALVTAAWAADNNFWRPLPPSALAASADSAANADARTVEISVKGEDTAGGVFSLRADKDGVRKLAKQLRAKQGGGGAAAAPVTSEQLLAQLREEEDARPKSRMEYRMNAVRMMSGARRNIAKKGVRKAATAADGDAPVAAGTSTAAAGLNAGTGVSARGVAVDLDALATTDPLASTFLFRSAQYAVLENAGTVELIIDRRGPSNFQASVAVRTKDGTANAGEDYEPIAGARLTFEAGETMKTLPVKIVDDNQWEPDETFLVELFDAKAAPGMRAALGAVVKSEVTILNDDNPGQLAFAAPEVTVRESQPFVELTVRRKNGCDGDVSIEYSTYDGTAVHTRDFIHTEGKLKFAHGEAAKNISVPIVDTDKDEDVFNSFTVVLKNPEGGALLTANKIATVTICHDDQFTGMINSVVSLMKLKRRNLKYSTGSWSEQFENAIRMSGDVDEDGMPLEPSALDFVMHFLTIGWKVLFAFVPPTEYCGGWLAFACAIVFIGILTGLVGELATLFGCVAGLKTSVTAITIVALGTSLPDTFASMTAAKQDRYADAAVGNVTGSNSVNVFLGMGLPWVLAVSLKGGDYHVPKGDLVFSVLVFTGCACTCFSLLLFRRWTVGGELGGPWFVKVVSSLICFGLWLVYLVASIGKAYGQW